LRFKELLRMCDPALPLDINDYGCGYGALATFLAESGQPFDYCGYDAAPAMIRGGGRPRRHRHPLPVHV
jgi:2-polyprenyl-3-methyl-5-hydroxy-6-metoxy-1,4-benzoquinol methylase